MSIAEDQTTPDDQIDPLTGLPRGQVSTQPLPRATDPGATIDPLTGLPSVVTDPSGNAVGARGPATTGVPDQTGGTGVPTVGGLTAQQKLAQSNPQASAGNGPEALIDALYAKAGIKDGGRGSGFADRAYWLEHPSEILNGRLGADLAGTGTDNPEGTPGSGPWQQSGRQAPQPQLSGGTSPTPGAIASIATPQQMATPTMPFWQQGGGQAQAMDTSGLTDSPVIRQMILNLLQGSSRG